jgi:hypothetical protein
MPTADATGDILRKAVVAEALAALSPAHRAVLNDTILCGRTVNDAATALGIPVGTVKSRVYYALHALRVALAERGLSAATACPLERHDDRPTTGALRWGFLGGREVTLAPAALVRGSLAPRPMMRC